MKLDKKSLAREKRLKNTPYNAMGVSDINFLEAQWIINWIWPETYWKWVRWLMTWLFNVLKYRKHDVNFWQRNGFHKANKELIDDSYLALSEEYQKICKEKWYKKIYKIPKYYISLPFKVWIISLAYSAVESPAWKRAYDASK